jgi:hypothetical protein
MDGMTIGFVISSESILQRNRHTTTPVEDPLIPASMP